VSPVDLFWKAAGVDLESTVLLLTGATSSRAVAEGHQSLVFELLLDAGQRAVAKVIDASLVDVDPVVARVETIAELADIDERVCCPLRIEDDFVNAVIDTAGARR